MSKTSHVFRPMPQPSLHSEWKLLLAATLETWCHELLYTRRVYPRNDDTVTNSYFLGIHCHANRHPDVVQYIQETVQVAVPALMAGLATEMSLMVLKNHFDVVERYALRMNKHMTGNGKAIWDDDTTEVDTTVVMTELEKGMRQIILSVQSLEGYRNSSSDAQLGDDATFKIRLLLSDGDSIDSGAAANESLTRAISDGKWHSPDSSELTISASQDQTRVEKVRPLHGVSLPGWDMHLTVHVKSDG